MHAKQIFLIEAQNLAVVHFYNRLSRVDLASGYEEDLPWLLDDTGLRIDVSAGGNFLAVGSWRAGLSVYDLEDRKKLWEIDLRKISDVSFLRLGAALALTTSDKCGVSLFEQRSGNPIDWDNDYGSVIENYEKGLLLAVDGSSKRIECLGGDFVKKWDFEWPSFSIAASSFREDQGILSSTDGLIGIVDFTKRKTLLVDLTDWCSGLRPLSISPEGNGFVALASEFQRTENSALVTLDNRGVLGEVIASLPPNRAAKFFSCGRKLIKSDGVVMDACSGQVISLPKW